MEYEEMVVFTQLVALFFFIVMFALVVTYVCWPGNRGKFDRAARQPVSGDDALQKREG